jgi:hypothetical protein
MPTHQILKQELLAEIEKLPDSQLSAVLEFVNTLQLPTQPALKEQDPLSSFIGAVSHGSLAHSIDPELYNAETLH